MIDRDVLKISQEAVEEINAFLTDEDNPLINELWAIVERYGGPAEINRKAEEARDLDNLMARLKDAGSPYLSDVEWLIEQREQEAFVSMDEYRQKVLGLSLIHI